jgi:hypothetical protein
MSFQLQNFNYFSSLVDRERVYGGSMERPASITVDGEVHTQVHSIANAANTVVYNDELSGFKYLNIASDFNTRALIHDNTGNSFSVSLRGTAETKKYGIPLTLGEDQTSAANARINTIRVYNSSGNTAKVRITVLK